MSPTPMDSGPVSSVGHLSMMRAQQMMESSSESESDDSEDSKDESGIGY